MKKSKIMLLGGAGFVFLIVLALTVFFRLLVDDFLESAGDESASVEATGIVETKEFDLKNFSELYFENMWDVEIIEGDGYGIAVEADQALFDEMTVRKDGRTVRFSYDRYVRGLSDSNDVVKVKLIMPDLEKIVFSGMGNIELKNFDLDNLVINNSGASNIEAENVSIEKLRLVVNGAANAQLDNIEVENCDLDISGAANIRLTMTGGRLTGQVSGAASVVYSGSVSEENVKVSGIGSLERK